MTGLQETLRQCAAKIEKYRGRVDRPLNEANTKVALVEVVLGALGWDTGEVDEVDREYRQVGRHNPTDYALILPDRHDRPCAVVEAKALGSDLADPRVISQALGYATDSGAPCAVLTDGDAWHLYDAHATEPGRDRLYRAVRVSEDEASAAEVLRLLTKEALRAGVLQELRRSERAERHLEEALLSLFDTSGVGHPKLVEVLAPMLPDLSHSELRGALSRLRPSFSFDQQPSPPPAPANSSPGPAIPRPASAVRGGSAGRSSSYRPVSGGEATITIDDLMDAGRLFPGRLTGTHKGELHVAELLPNGHIRYQGHNYKSPSGASTVARNAIADNGWNWWHTEHHVGRGRVTLAEVRRRYAEGREG